MDVKQNSKQQQQTSKSSSTTTAAAAGTKRVLTCKQLPDEKVKENYSLSITDTLYNLFDRAIQEEFSHIPSAAVLITSSRVADYQCNSAMAISKVINYIMISSYFSVFFSFFSFVVFYFILRL